MAWYNWQMKYLNSKTYADKANVNSTDSVPVEVEAVNMKLPFVMRLLLINLIDKAKTALVQEAQTESAESTEKKLEEAFTEEYN
ncbi:hypothetical protein DSO57_1028078 [Entomophthora muscae]|uniref:Uncharacterized protein n=1 Tax=Entomophthora muscae TaxID=34485 RepID=A0ACC2RSL1_9FUNG|nr:hypothetical protein DSO57_1028078 [Entomophthora muscae]